RGPERARHVGQGLAQRALPVRLGQEVQALPRQVRISLRMRWGRIQSPGVKPLALLSAFKSIRSVPPGACQDARRKPVDFKYSMAFAKVEKRLNKILITI